MSASSLTCASEKGLIAVTGGTGFIGRGVVARLITDGWRVRALVRRHDAALAEAGAALLHGSLEDERSLERLVVGATAVVHCAGIIKASRADAFHRINQGGAARIAAAVAGTASPPRLILMSSLAAREPELSPYAASKRAAEVAVQGMLQGTADFCIVRPPAVYGPRDRATLPIFQQLQRGLLFVPAVRSRFSLIYVDDLAELVRRLLDAPPWQGAVLEPDDGSGGYRWDDLARIAGARLGRRIRTVPVPRRLLWPVAALAQAGGAALQRAPALTLGKLRELYHPDWVCRGAAETALAGHPRRLTFENGFAVTLAWYKQIGWL